MGNGQSSTAQAFNRLWAACQSGDLKFLERATAGATNHEQILAVLDFHNESFFNWTLLHLSAYQGQEEIVKFLVERGVNPNTENEVGETPLHCASNKGHESIVRYLIQKGATPDYVSHKRLTPLFRAAQKGHITIVQLLLGYGADVNQATVERWTPLAEASFEGHANVVKYLLKHGADPSLANGNLWTPFHRACAAGRAGVVRALIDYKKKGGRINLHARTIAGRTPRDLAKKGNKFEVVKMIDDFSSGRDGGSSGRSSLSLPVMARKIVVMEEGDQPKGQCFLLCW